MMKADRHTIRKTTVNFRFSGKVEGLSLQQEVSEWSRTLLTSAIDSALSDFDSSEEVLCIDKIQLDIESGRKEDWESGLIENIIKQFKENLLARIGSNPGDVEVKSKQASFAEALVYFLEHGFMPWYSSIGTRNDFNIEIEGWLKTSSPDKKKNLLKNLQEKKSITRFVNLLKEHDFETLIAVATGCSQENISSLFETVKVITDSIAGEKSLQQRLLNDFKEMLVTGFLENQAVSLPENTFTEWLYIQEKKFPFEIRKCDIDLIINTGAKSIIRQIQKDHNLKSLNKAGINLTDHVFKVTETGREPGGEFKDGVFISNAGAVIIAPFLNTLFIRTRLLEEDVITDKPTTLSLVHYCITGNTDPAEFELLLPKIICGIDPETVIDPGIRLDDSLLVEADKMLLAIIEYWEILKETTITGLREAFLQRNGKLSFVGDEWLLQVESRSYDMLLDQLPWGIGLIKLPWMEQMLRVEWR